MTRPDLVAAAAALDGDLAAATAHADTAREFAARLGERGADTVVAASLHHYYTAVEALTERAMRAFGHSLPGGPRWHSELLELAATSIPGTRPALLGPESLRGLRELLAFRHFFRHAYAVDWDHDRLRRNVAVMNEVSEPLAADVGRFVATLRAAAVG